jgi:hypothetical protein
MTILCTPPKETSITIYFLLCLHLYKPILRSLVSSTIYRYLQICMHIISAFPSQPVSHILVITEERTVVHFPFVHTFFRSISRLRVLLSLHTKPPHPCTQSKSKVRPRNDSCKTTLDRKLLNSLPGFEKAVNFIFTDIMDPY